VGGQGRRRAAAGKTKIAPELLPKMLGATHDQEAIAHWNTNPDRHEMRAKAKQIKAKKDWNKDKDKSPWCDGDGAPDWFSLAFPSRALGRFRASAPNDLIQSPPQV